MVIGSPRVHHMRVSRACYKASPTVACHGSPIRGALRPVLRTQEVIQVLRIVSRALEGQVGCVLEDLLSFGVDEGRGLLVQGVQQCLLLPSLQNHIALYNFYSLNLIFP